VLVPVPGNPARSLEFAMSLDLFPSSFNAAVSASMLVRDVAGSLAHTCALASC